MRRLAFLAASLLLLLPASADAAKARIKAVAVTPASVAPGDAVRVRVTVAGGKAGRLALLLSADARRSAGDQRVRKVKVPGRKGKRVVKANVNLPSAGSVRVLACLGKRCRASAPILVVAQSTGPPAAAPTPAQPTATAQPTPSAAPTVTASPTAAPTATPTPTPPPGFDPAATPAPSDALDVTPTLEPDRAVTEVVDSEEGGTITATAAGGATFTLTIPPAGLFEDETITMTPVAGLSGLPIAAAPAAVDIQPHGLDLGEPATLTITPAAAIPVADQFTFAAREGGLDVHGYPPTASTSAIELPLTHFSIYGAAAATDAEVADVTGRVAVDAQAQFEAEISGLLQETKRTGRENDTTQYAAIMRRLFDTVVRPRLIAAESDDTLAVLAVSSFLGWERQRQLLGDDGSLDGLATEGNNRVETIIEYAYGVAVGRCLGGDLGAGGSLMHLARQAALLGVDLPTSVYTDLESCLRFEIDYEVGLQVVNPRPNLDDTEYTDVTVTATDVPLRFELGERGQFTFVGTAPPVVAAYDYYRDPPDGDCDTVDAGFEVKEPVDFEMLLGVRSHRVTAPDGRTRFELDRERPTVNLIPGRIQLLVKNCADPPTVRHEHGVLFRNVWKANLDAFDRFRFTSFFDESLPRIGLFLEDRAGTYLQSQLQSRLRMEIEFKPPPPP